MEQGAQPPTPATGVEAESGIYVYSIIECAQPRTFGRIGIGGRGNDVATVAGAVGGAVVGHEIEKGNRVPDAYRIRVRMDNGSYESFTQDSANDLRVGDHARIENERVYRYSENARAYRYDNRGNRY